MGALDDAIREHLELKRRHGASDDEIAQAEAEALGPARRSPAVEPGIDASDEYVSQDPVEPPPGAYAAAEDEAPLYDDPPPDAADAAVDAPPPPPPPALEEPGRYHIAPEPEFDAAVEAEVEEAVEEADPDRARTAILDDPLEDMPPEPPRAVQHDPGPDEPPAPARPHGAVAAPEPEREPEPAADEDVLEETPDFLQETPEHDRLWFEQKPPRDFDFD